MVVVHLQPLAWAATDGTPAALQANHGIHLGRSQAMHLASHGGAGVIGTEDVLPGACWR